VQVATDASPKEKIFNIHYCSISTSKTQIPAELAMLSVLKARETRPRNDSPEKMQIKVRKLSEIN
jgi:hypothetical protein